MKTVLIIFIVLAITLLMALAMMAISSMSGTATGLVNGKLARCPDSSNCICSEFNPDKNFIEPMPVAASEKLNSGLIAKIVQNMGGTVHELTDDYLSSTFASSVFGFVDDLEIRIDREQKTVHFRSASRVGRNDFGVNHKRVEQLKLLLSETGLHLQTAHSDQ